MKRNRVRMMVEVDLDPIPGAFNTEEDHRDRLLADLKYKFPHYNPAVEIVETITVD